MKLSKILVPIGITTLALASLVIEIDYYFAPMFIVAAGIFLAEAGSWKSERRMAILCCATLITGFGLAALQFAYESNPAWPPVIIPAVIAAVPNLILIHRSSVGISLAPPVMLLSTLFVVTISHTGMEWTLLLGTAFWSWISYRTAISSKFSPTVARLSAIPSALTALFHAIFGLAYVGTMRSVGDSYIASSEQSSLLMQDGELSNLTTTFFMNELNASLPMHYALSFLIVSSGATLLSSWLALIHHRSPEDQ